jgi:hypothetical protein
VDLVHEEDVPRLQVRQDGREVAGPLQHGAGGRAEPDPELAGDDLGERGLAEPRRAEEEDVVQRVAAAPGGLDEDGEVVRSAGCPVKSARVCGRSVASAASSSWRCPAVTRAVVSIGGMGGI